MRITKRAARINAGLTQEDVATALNVTKKTVSSWETGKTNPDINKVEAICELYGMKYDDIKWNG